MWISNHLLVLSVVVAVAVGAAVDNDLPLESDEIIEAVNNAKTTWKAGRNFHPSLKKGYLKNLVGSLKPSKEKILPILEDDDDEDLEIPDSFDAREKWSQCSSIGEIPNQGPCACGWAVAAVGAFTDRFCIASKGDVTVELSAQNLLSCCCPCAVSCGQGCKGGHMDQAWVHLTYTGVVSGGPYKSQKGCQPSQLPPCNHDKMFGELKNCSSYGDVPTPHCQQTCYNKNYKEHKYSEDFRNGTQAFMMSNNIKMMQKQIMKYGPVETGFVVYDDFLSYISGVYKHTEGNDCCGSHALKVIGWGTESVDGSDVPYWLVINSWGPEWGDSGTAKIFKGTNECGIEEEVCGGYVNVKT